MGTAGWQFLPSGHHTPSRASVLEAARAGPGALSRELRAARARLGAVRAATLLRAAEAEAGQRFGRPLRMLIATTQQPRSLEAPLTLGFAIAGFALALRSIEGIGDLSAALAAQAVEADPLFAGLDLSLLSMPEDTAAPERERLLAGLAQNLAARSQAPVAVARFRRPEEAVRMVESAVGVVPLDLPVDTLFDTRFGGTFGSILAASAADRLADAAAGWAARVAGTAPKLVITDLDGTLWAGVLGEGTPPVVHRAYAEALAGLRERGLVLALASRNDEGDVEAALAEGLGGPLRPASFAARAVGWADKPALVAEILADLGLAPEHAVFLDDDPVNCAAVAARFPAMDVRLAGDPDALAAALLADPLLSGGERGAERAAQYERRAAVERLRGDAPDEAAFLRSLETRVTLLPLDARLVPRAAELASRVNQFLFTDLRPNALQLAARPPGFNVMARLDDAFGAHGLVGLVLASRQGDALVIDNLFLSCRALQRGVEGILLYGLAEPARRAGLHRIVGRIDPLPRNAPALDALARHGFVQRGDDWIYDLGLAGGPLAVVPEGLVIAEPGEAV